MEALFEFNYSIYLSFILLFQFLISSINDNYLYSPVLPVTTRDEYWIFLLKNQDKNETHSDLRWTSLRPAR